MGFTLRKAIMMLVLGATVFTLGCAKMNDNTQSATVFINRGSALYNQQVNNGIPAYLAIDPMYTNEFNQVMRAFYAADGTQISGNIDPVNGVTINMIPVNFNQSTGQAVINASSPPMMTMYTKAGTQTYAISMAARSGGVVGQNFTLVYGDDFRQITLYGQCANGGVQGPVSYVLRNQQAAGEQLLGYFSMPGMNNYCAFF